MCASGRTRRLICGGDGVITGSDVWATHVYMLWRGWIDMVGRPADVVVGLLLFKDTAFCLSERAVDKYFVGEWG